MTQVDERSTTDGSRVAIDTVTSGRPWTEPLRSVYRAPWVAARRWREQGGRVVGLLGGCAPRELIMAAGMLPMRLRPAALDAEPPAPLPDGLARELTPSTAAVLAALWGGGLRWIDALLIGRDCEAHTKLFYVLRELAAERPDRLPPVAFSDMLRLPSRTSARYNRRRLADLRGVVGGWAERSISDAELVAAVADSARTAAALAALDELRIARRVSGADALLAAVAAQMLPGPAVREALAAAAGPPRTDVVPVFLTGSDLDDTHAYEAIEQAGAAIVGEDHGWGDDGREVAAATSDPLDGIVDRYQFSARRSARAGLERVVRTAERVRRSGARGVLQVIRPDDEASAWELPALRAALPDLPVHSVRLAQEDRPALREATAEILSTIGAIRV
ncbi:MAG TPA: 2-hydroxyacyl-CoA dehydratase family protein [Solirubrobacteraceae bacterium]|nr:2-hydroxyacyl-CoA dehydratase family protein [Solirubrobacteraceae bacterium]